MELNFLQDIEVDEYDLVEMQKDQPEKLFIYSEELTKAKEKLDNLTLQVNITSAEVDKKIRSGNYPEAEGIKLTETSIKSLIDSDKNLNSLKMEVIKQKALVGKIQAAVDAFHNRKSSINNLVTLWVGNYYAEEPTKRDKNNVMEAQKQGIANITKK